MRAFFVLLKKEFLQLFRTAFLPVLIVAYPIVIMLLMPMIMTMDVRNVNVAVVDMDHSGTSRRIVSHIGASDYFNLVPGVADFASGMGKLEEGNVDVIVQIPHGFERGLMLSSPEKISLTANAVNATKGSMGMQYLGQSIASVLSELSAERSPFKASELISVQNRFNPTLDYRHYMIPALMIMLFIIICGFLPALSIVSEKEKGTIEQINVSPVGRFTFTLAKLIPYWIIGLFVLAVAMLVAYLVYGLAPAGPVSLIVFGALLFILTISGFSLMVANSSDTMQQSIFVMFFFVMIFMLMSGLLTPVSSMPAWAQKLTIVLPPRYFVEILRSVYLKAACVADLATDFLALGIFALVFDVLAALSFKKQH